MHDSEGAAIQPGPFPGQKKGMNRAGRCLHTHERDCRKRHRPGAALSDDMVPGGSGGRAPARRVGPRLAQPAAREARGCRQAGRRPLDRRPADDGASARDHPGAGGDHGWPACGVRGGARRPRRASSTSCCSRPRPRSLSSSLPRSSRGTGPIPPSIASLRPAAPPPDAAAQRARRRLDREMGGRSRSAEHLRIGGPGRHPRALALLRPVRNGRRPPAGRVPRSARAIVSGPRAAPCCLCVHWILIGHARRRVRPLVRSRPANRRGSGRDVDRLHRDRLRPAPPLHRVAVSDDRGPRPDDHPHLRPGGRARAARRGEHPILRRGAPGAHRGGPHAPAPAGAVHRVRPSSERFALQGQPHDFEPRQALLPRARLRNFAASRGDRDLPGHRDDPLLRHGRRASGRHVLEGAAGLPRCRRPRRGRHDPGSRGDDSGHLQDALERHGSDERGHAALTVEPHVQRPAVRRRIFADWRRKTPRESSVRASVPAPAAEIRAPGALRGDVARPRRADGRRPSSSSASFCRGFSAGATDWPAAPRRRTAPAPRSGESPAFWC